MNEDRVRETVKDYLQQFPERVGTYNDEMKKWRAAWDLKQWDIDAEDFAGMFHQCFRHSDYLLSVRGWKPKHAVMALLNADEGAYAEQVRAMFRALITDSPENLKERGKCALKFIKDMNELEEKVLPEKDLYLQDIRSALTFMGLIRPDRDYIYKTNTVGYYARYTEAGDAFGSGTTFKLEAFYKFMDQLSALISEEEELVSTVKEELKRQGETRKRPGLEEVDPNCHLLAFDLMYRTNAYGFSENHPVISSRSRSAAYSSATAKTRMMQEQRELEQDVQDLARVLTSEEERLEEYKLDSFVGQLVKHPKFGEGTILTHEDSRVTVKFGEEEKRLGLKFVLENHWMEDEEVIDQYLRKMTTIAQIDNCRRIIGRKEERIAELRNEIEKM